MNHTKSEICYRQEENINSVKRNAENISALFYFMYYFLLGVNSEIKSIISSHHLVLPQIYETLRLTFKQPLLLAADEFGLSNVMTAKI